MAQIVGQKIVAVRAMTDAELAENYWHGERGTAIELENGTVLFPSRDDEGNGPGRLFGKLPTGEGIYVR